MVGFELGGWDVAEFAVQAPVVEPFDVGEGLELNVVGVAPRAAATDQFGLVDPVEALGEAVVPRRQRHLSPRVVGELSG